MTYEQQILKEGRVEEKKTSLRTQSRQLEYAGKITGDLSFHASIFLEEQHKLSLAKDETAAQLLKRLSDLSEAAAKLSLEFSNLSTLRLKQADNLTLANFEK